MLKFITKVAAAAVCGAVVGVAVGSPMLAAGVWVFAMFYMSGE